jgi:hypothetical protein
MIDAELSTGIVVGLYDAGKQEIYGFGKAAPNGKTLFELGPVTGVYTSLLFADTVQRKLVELDTPVSEFLPPGVTAPTAEKIAITLHHLAMGSSGLPSLPPSLERAQSADAFAKYNEDALYRDLVHTQLLAPPGTMLHSSSYGAAVLGFALGKKLGARKAPTKTSHPRRESTSAFSPVGLASSRPHAISSRSSTHSSTLRPADARRFARRWLSHKSSRPEGMAPTSASVGTSTARVATGKRAARRAFAASSASIRRIAAAS